MDKVIVTVLLTIVGVVSVIAIYNVIYPVIGRSGSAVTTAAGTVDDRIKSQITVVHATGEMDENQDWQDTDSHGDFDIFMWVKNVGATKLLNIEETDVFFGKEGDFARIPYVDDAGGAKPHWTYALENDTAWKPTATLKISIHYTNSCTPAPCSPTPLASDTYYIRVISSNGMSDDHFMGL